MKKKIEFYILKYFILIIVFFALIGGTNFLKNVYFVNKDGYDKTYPSIELVRIENIFFKKKGNLLDFGCGPGSNGLHFLKKGFQVTFCDISSKALSNVRKKL